MELTIGSDGRVGFVYTEEMPMESVGRVSVRRASSVEPTDNGDWTADLSQSGGPTLGPFESRSQAINAEVAWLELHLEKVCSRASG